MATALSRRPAAARTTASPPEVPLAEYAQLKARVRETLVLGQQRIEAARVITYWRTGWYIQTHIKLQAGRADYGAQVVARLARDFEMDESVLRRCVYFVERLPHLFDAKEIHATWHESLPAAQERPLLTWSHYRVLLAVPDARRREALLQQATEHEWPVAELEARIRREAARSDADAPTRPPQLLTPLRGSVGLFQIKDVAGTRYWDLGFESYRALSSLPASGDFRGQAGAQARAFKVGDLVRLAEGGTLVRAPEAKPTELYTYEARLLRVVDGDTLWLLIQLAGADWRQEKLRLRGVDCPELGTPAGEAAKRYVQTQLQSADRLTITTTKPDQWDRYLSDVFCTTADGEEIYLNHRLLDAGHARRYTAVSPEDWGH